MNSKNLLKIGCFILFFTSLSCKNDAVEKPKNLIAEDQMTEILYEMAILEGIRLNNPSVFKDYKIDPAQHLFEKYKIDSLQFAESNFYYASDVNKYLELYQKIQAKIDLEYQKTDSISKTEIKKMENIVLKKIDTFQNKKINSRLIKENKINKD